MLGTYAEIPFCTAYELDGRRTTDLPPTRLLERVTPVYERLAGWGEDIGAIREQAALPAAARAYLKRIAETVGAPIGLVGVGPERSATLLS